MKRLGIEKIGVHIPNEILSVIDLGKKLNAKEEFIRTKLGFLQLTRKSQSEETSDLCVKAIQNLAIDLIDIDCLVVVTQNPDSYGLPHTSAIVHKKLGLKSNLATFDVSLGCSGYVQGLSIITGFMQANSFTKGLLVTADPYSKIIDPEDRDTMLLFGDAATCTLISDQPKYTVEKTVYATSGDKSDAIQVNYSNRKLKMNGNQVFRFVSKNIPKQIKNCISLNKLVFEDIDLFCVHQGSKYIVDTLRTVLNLQESQMPFLANKTGNTISSSLPLILSEYFDGQFSKIILSGFGVGLSSATTLIRGVQNEN